MTRSRKFICLIVVIAVSLGIYACILILGGESREPGDELLQTIEQKVSVIVKVHKRQDVASRAAFSVFNMYLIFPY